MEAAAGHNPVMHLHSALRLLVTVATVSFLPACAHQSYQAQYGTTVRSAAVGEEVVKPKRMHYRDLTNVVTDGTVGIAAGVAGGLVGGTIYAVSSRGLSRGSGRNLEETMAINHIQVEEIVRRNTVEELAHSGLFAGGAGLQRAVTAGHPDAVMRLKVEEYGFGQSGFLKRGLVPVLKVEGQLVRTSDQKELWEESVEVDARNRAAEPHLYEEYRTNPALLREALNAAARAVAADMVRNMKGEKEVN